MSSGFRKWTLWEVNPSKMKKEIVHGVGGGNVGALASRDSFAPQKEKKWMMART
jgi:hypothetical protein